MRRILAPLAFFHKTSLYILIAPLLFTFIGATSNQLVLIANRDTFPVMVNDKKIAALSSPEAAFGQAAHAVKAYRSDVMIESDAIMMDDVHCVMTNKTHLNFLADIFDMKDAIYSIGDFLLILGEWLMAFAPFVFLFDVSRKLAVVKTN